MEQLLSQIDSLEESFTQAETFTERIEIKDKILELKREAGLIKPPDSPYVCEGCSG